MYTHYCICIRCWESQDWVDNIGAGKTIEGIYLINVNEYTFIVIMYGYDNYKI